MRASVWISATCLVIASPAAFAQSETPPPAVAETAAAADGLDEARAAFRRGLAEYDQRHFREALVSLRASLERMPSPNSRLYVARCLRELGDIAEAVNEFETTANDAAARAATEPRYATTRDAARAEQQPLLARVARLRIATEALPADSTVRIAGREVTGAALAAPIAVAPGSVPVAFVIPGRPVLQTNVTAAAGRESRVEVPTAPSAEVVAIAPDHVVYDTRLRVASYAGFGVGVIGFATLGVFAALSSSQYNGLVQRCGMMPCPESERGAISTGLAYDAMANLGLGLGIIGALAGGALFYLSGRPSTHGVHVAILPMSIAFGGEF